jgi:hypothetical protein
MFENNSEDDDSRFSLLLEEALNLVFHVMSLFGKQ